MLTSTSCMEKLVISFLGNVAFWWESLQFWGKMYHLDGYFGRFLTHFVLKICKILNLCCNLLPYSRDILHLSSLVQFCCNLLPYSRDILHFSSLVQHHLHKSKKNITLYKIWEAHAGYHAVSCYQSLRVGPIVYNLHSDALARTSQEGNLSLREM